VELGIDVLQKNNFDLLRGKRVGLVTNQTGVNSAGEKTRLILRKHVNLTALYTPEHGLDGTEKAGVEIRSRKDPLTGLEGLVALRRHPQADARDAGGHRRLGDRHPGHRLPQLHLHQHHGQMPAGLRGTGKELVILDRPNLLGGNRVEGMGIDSMVDLLRRAVPGSLCPRTHHGGAGAHGQCQGLDGTPMQAAGGEDEGMDTGDDLADDRPALGADLAEHPAGHVAELLRHHGNRRRSCGRP